MNNFPQNTRALRMVDDELLQPIISRAESQEDIVSILEKEATTSRTAKVWVGCLPRYTCGQFQCHGHYISEIFGD